MHTIEDIAVTHDDVLTTRVSQVVDASGTVVLTSDPAADRPLADPVAEPGEVRVTVTGALPGIGDGTYAVAVTDAVGSDDRPYTVIVATPTRVETTALGRSLEFGLIGAIGLVAILGSVTTFAVGQALRPVDRMRDQVEAIASSRPAPTLEVPEGRDELSVQPPVKPHARSTSAEAKSVRTGEQYSEGKKEGRKEGRQFTFLLSFLPSFLHRTQ